MRHIQKTKDIIFDTAVRMFSEHGYSNISTREIARAADVNESTAYYYFKNKEAFLDEILEEFRRKLKRYLITKEQAEQYLKTDTPRELLERFIPRYKGPEALFMLRAQRIVCMEFFTNEKAKEIVMDQLLSDIAASFKGALDTLIDHGMIAAFDTEPISVIWADFLFSQSIVHLSSYIEGDMGKFNSHHALVYVNVLIDLVVTGKLTETGQDGNHTSL